MASDFESFNESACGAFIESPNGVRGSAGSTQQFSAATYTVPETNVTVIITVKRTDGSSGAVGVSYASSNGTATAGSDYIAKTGTLSWANGDTADKNFPVFITNDNDADLNETFNVTLSSPTNGAVLGALSTAVVTITNEATERYNATQFNGYSRVDQTYPSTTNATEATTANTRIGKFYNGTAKSMQRSRVLARCTLPANLTAATSARLFVDTGDPGNFGVNLEGFTLAVYTRTETTAPVKDPSFAGDWYDTDALEGTVAVTTATVGGTYVSVPIDIARVKAHAGTDIYFLLCQQNEIANAGSAGSGGTNLASVFTTRTVYLEVTI